MTDNEIIKALECCKKSDKTGDCTKCSLWTDKQCMQKLFKNILALINRQKVEIERLKEENFKILAERNREHSYCMHYVNMIAKAESKGRKEFAERLKKESVLIYDPTDRATMLIIIDALLEEMEGEGK